MSDDRRRQGSRNPFDDPTDLGGMRDLARAHREERQRRRRIRSLLVLLAGLALFGLYWFSTGGGPAVPTEAPPPETPEAPEGPAAGTTATPTPTSEPTRRPTATPKPAVTPTRRVVPTATPVPTKRPTAVPTSTPTPVPTATPRPTSTPTVPPPTATPVPPVVDVISDPVDATVVVDGTVRGQTPLRLRDLSPGYHEIRVRKEGFVDYLKGTELENGSRYELEVTLAPVVNSLRVVTEPAGATVFLDGERKGSAPVTIHDLRSGSYEVVVRNAEGREIRREIDLAGGEVSEVRFTFPSPSRP